MSKLITVALLLAFASSSYASDDLSYGSALLQTRFNEYHIKYELCQSLANETLLSDKDIETISELSSEAGIGLGFYQYKAIENCSKNEYLSLLTTLLSLEVMNRSQNLPAIQDQVHMIKHTLFTLSSINIEKSFVDLPKEIIDTLEEIPALKEPFNHFNAYDRAWPQSQ